MKTFLLSLFSFLLLGLLSTPGHAQDFAFRVLATQGTNTADNVPLKVGTRLKENQTIVMKGSYLSLAHSSGKAIEVQSGTHKIKDLLAKVNQNGQGLASKYADFVVNELTQDDAAVAHTKTRFQHMNRTGSVQRDISVVSTMLPMNTKIFGSHLTLRWYMRDNTQISDKSSFKIQVLDLSDELLKEMIISPQASSEWLSTTINLSSPELKDHSQLICKVIPLDPDGKALINPQAIDGNIVLRLEGNECNAINNELEQIGIVSQNQSPTALSKLIEARFYEEKELLADAIFAYEQAIKLADGAEQYKRIYQFFLDRNGLSREAREEIANASNNR